MNKKAKFKKITGILAVLLCIVLVFGCVNAFRANKPSSSDAAPADATADESSAVPTKTGSTSATLICAGDNLIHKAIYTQAKSRAGGNGYDFSYAYKDIASYVSAADIAFLNQETVIVPSKEASSYPLFNSPKALLDEMTKIGFDVFNQSTNHVMDKGLSGALEDYDLFHSYDNIILTGLYKTWDEMFVPQTMTKNDITFSFVGFSEYLNGLVVPKDSDLGLVYLTDTRHTKEELYSTMQKMIDAAKKASDVVCVSMHWQTEDITTPNASEKEIVQKLVDMGADIIIGTGPHVLQPIEFVEREDGSKVLVIWSLGNFISTQANKPNLLGGLADVTVKKDYATGKTSVENVKFIPTVTHYGAGRSNVRIIPFSKYSESLASSHGAGISYSYIKKFYEDMYGDLLDVS